MTTRSHIGHLIKKSYDNKKWHRASDHCNKSGDSIHVQGFQCPVKKYQSKVCNKYGHFSSLCYQRKPKCITRLVTEILKCTNYMQVPCMHRTVPITVILKSPALMNHFAYSYKHTAIRLKVSRFHNLFIL